MSTDPYRELQQRLDALPNGFPPAPDGAELRLLARLFTPEEAALAARLRLTLETPEAVAARLESTDLPGLKNALKLMARKGLIRAGRAETGVGYGLMPFVVGIYEAQAGRIDAELARLFEAYYRQAFAQVLQVQPALHRVVPVGESVRNDMEIHPYESAAGIVAGAQAWGVLDCICRTQKALIGQPCEHPIESCMVLGSAPGAFDNHPAIRALDREQALATLHRCAQAGLVHTVSNNQRGLWYICNCCTCSCGLLRGMAELGIAGVVARSAFVNQVDPDICLVCELCLEWCQFDALGLDGGMLVVDALRCTGCGVCVPACPDGALGLVRRPEADQPVIPTNELDWLARRAMARGRDLADVL